MDEVEKLKNQFLKRKAISTTRQIEYKNQIIAQYGTIDKFKETLHFWTINRPNDLRLPEVYRFYASFFTIPEEQESFEGFETAMSFNNCVERQKELGAFKEEWLLVNDEQGNLVAGINFSCYVLPCYLKKSTNTDGSMHIMYIFVKEELRSLGIASLILAKTEQLATDWIAQKKNCLSEQTNILITCEQNAPELMTAVSYFTDCLNAQIDQCDRLIWWDKKGFKRLMINYIQPALNEHSDPCTTLTLNIKAKGEENVSGVLLLEHLRRYFNISVFKGELPDKDPYFRQIEAYLSEHEVKIEGNREYYDRLKKTFYLPSSNHHPKLKLYTCP